MNRLNRYSIIITVALIGFVRLQAMAGTDGVWKVGGSGQPLWSEQTNWDNGVVADGQDATAHFDTVDVGAMAISLENGTRTIGHLIFDDTVGAADNWWDIRYGTLNLSVSSGISTVKVSNLTGGIGISAALTGNFRKTGNQILYLKTMPNGSIDIAEGAVSIGLNYDNVAFTTQSISGSGDLIFQGQQNGYFTFRNDYSATLSYTGRTRVNLQPGWQWYQGMLWLEKDDVLPHGSVLDLLSGKVCTRNQTINGLTVAGLTGNVGTYFTTEQVPHQKLTLDLPTGASCDYAGTIDSNISLTKKGPGTQVLSGVNTFLGALNVNGGTLLVNNATGSGGGVDNFVTVAAGATIGGTGTLFSASTVIQPGARLAPGGTNNVGTLTFGGSLSLAEGSTYGVNYTAAASDSVSVGGTLTLPGILTVQLAAFGAAALPKHLTLFEAGSLAGATDLSGWQVLGAGVQHYQISCEGTTSVVATRLPMGTVITIL